MTTPRIEEMVEEFFEDQNNIWKSETGMSIAEAKIAEKKLLSDILTLTHQAGIEEAVEIVENVRPTSLPDSYSEGDDIISRDDTIKALQDKK